MRAPGLRLAVALAVALLAGGCKRSHGAIDGGVDGATAALSDAGADGRGVGAAGSATAGLAPDAAPADDLIPSAESSELTARARHLLEAIANDNADLASDILFPRDGWLATRDAADPGKDWDKRVAGPFRRAVHALSARHGGELQRAQFASLELGRAIVQETPRRRGWKKPLWQVHESRLTFVVDGHTRSLSIREMTAWRGAWYVTRLR